MNCWYVSVCSGIRLQPCLSPESVYVNNGRLRGSVLSKFCLIHVYIYIYIYLFISVASAVGAKHAIIWSWTKFPIATTCGPTYSVQARRETVPNATSSRSKGMHISHGLLVQYRMPKSLIFC